MASTEILVEKQRISSIDLMRGIVMVIMALDHCRDFLHASLINPTDLSQTNAVLFFTRFVTHFCAPTFVLLSGTSIFLSTQRKTKKELSVFLLTRGLWLMVLEVVVFRFSFLFNFYYDVIFFQVIWVIGLAMLFMAGIIHLPKGVILALGLLICFGHNALDGVQFTPVVAEGTSGNPPINFQNILYLVWTYLHAPGFLPVSSNLSLLVMYPLIPWLGIMMMGYCLGSWYTKDVSSEQREKYLRVTGAAAIGLFVVIRFANVYGDPAPWSLQKDTLFTFMSFINCTKYGPSLLYTLMTLGPVLIILSYMEKHSSKLLSPFLVFGRVPLFYYVLHFYLIHLIALVLYLIKSGKSLSDIDFHFSATFGGVPRGEGYSLGVVYIIWLSVVVFLYPFCKWYNQYKSTHKQWWLSYL